MKKLDTSTLNSKKAGPPKEESKVKPCPPKEPAAPAGATAPHTVTPVSAPATAAPAAPAPAPVYVTPGLTPT